MNDHLTDEMKTIISIDFDGTCTDHSDGWQGESIIGPPVHGVQEAFKELKARGFSIVIHSCRARTDEGRQAIMNWLAVNGLIEYVAMITAYKVPALCYIDDRAIKFDGNWPEALHKISGFKSWGE